MKSILKQHSMEPMFHHHDEQCGCGHIHHDHHEEGVHCDCGHDHDHHHGHHHDHSAHDHHGDSCGCGCGHDHEDHGHHHDEEDSGGDGDEEHSHQLELSKANKKVYLLENLGCAHCASKMEEQINKLPGIEAATITFATKQLRIAADDPDSHLERIRQICSSIESQVKVVQQPERRNAAAANTTSQKKKISKNTLELISIIAGAVLFAGGVIIHHTDGNPTMMIVLSVLSYLILGGRVILEALRNISKGQVFDENFLMSIATIGAFCIAEYLEAVGVMLFYRIGEYFEHKAVERSRGQIMDAIDMRPEVVHLIQGDDISIIPAEDAKPGDLLLIRPGDRIPLDGIVTEGESRIDTSPITGEPVPVGVKSGESVLSGCVNTSGQLTMRVEKPLEESMVSKILDSVENAAASKPKLDRFITRFSRIYTPCVVGAALLLAIVPSLITGDWNYWVYTALTFLVMSCPCALVLSVPLAFFSGIGAGGRRGILFKGGISIEALGKLKAVVMDKTGTITEGNFQLQKVIAADGFDENQLLALCAGCEQRSTHPIAVSIVNAALDKGLEIPAPAVLEEISGHGIAARIEEVQVLCGNRKLMAKYHVQVQIPENADYGAEVFIAIDSKFAGCMIISDTLKDDAEVAVSRLKSMGLYTVMLTGDSEDSANAAAVKTGIDQVFAKLLPQDKLEKLTEIRQQKGSVMFVGDGINDAPVLAGADVGAAMGSGADAAIEAADAVFMNTSVESIPDSIAIAKATSRIAMQNVVFALVIKAIVMALGIAGYANMWLAVFADSGVAMLCVLNSIRILYKK